MKRWLSTGMVLAFSIATLAAPAARAGHQDLGTHTAAVQLTSGAEAGAPQASPAVQIVEAGGFQWGDAAIGAAVALGVLMLATGVVVVLRHGRVRSV